MNILAATKAVAFAEDAVSDVLNGIVFIYSFEEFHELYSAKEQVRRIAAAGIEAKESE